VDLDDRMVERSIWGKIPKEISTHSQLVNFAAHLKMAAFCKSGVAAAATSFTTSAISSVGRSIMMDHTVKKRAKKSATEVILKFIPPTASHEWNDVEVGYFDPLRSEDSS